MKTTIKRTTKAIVIAAVLVICFVLFLPAILGTNTSDAYSESVSAARLTADESGAMLDIVKDGQSSYKVIFAAADDLAQDAVSAEELTMFMRAMGAVRVNYRSDHITDEGEKEILIGETNRKTSQDLTAEAKAAAPEDGWSWIVAEKDGNVYIVANCDQAIARAVKEFMAFATESDLSIPVGYRDHVVMTREEIENEHEQNKELRIEELKKQIADFKNTDFTNDEQMDPSLTIMPSTGWGSPQLYPTEGDHPRVNITSFTLEAIRDYIENTEEGKYLYDAMVEFAKREYTGILADPYEHTSGRMGFHNVDETGLAIIEARAFVYLVSGDEEYGYSAVLAMKNYLDTFYLGWIHSDQCREFGRTMFVTAEIYDWCYDLLTETDKEQFIIACTYIATGNAGERYGGAYSGLCQSGDAYMEVGYPPTAQGSVAGHGAEAQILRDYLSIAIAIYDENPSWYEGVASRVYNDYIPFRDYYFQAGMYPQGICNYAPHRHSSDVWSAWLLYCATGENPYSDGLHQVSIGFLEYMAPDGSFFGTGDGERAKTIKSKAYIYYIITLCSALYGDANLWDYVLDYHGGSLVGIKTGAQPTFSTVHLLLFGAEYYRKTGMTESVDLRDGQDVVNYHAYPIGEMIARREWHNADAPSVYMIAAEKSTSNHEHGDSGTFQLFYKGLYLGESGVYDKYGSHQWRYYHQATVAHNGILIFDPEKAEYALDGETPETSTNLAKCFYSGGQRHGFGAGDSLLEWLSATATEKATVTGHEYALNMDGTADYAYLAADITKAYTSLQASYIAREMIAIFTGDSDYPMYFIVYDAIDAAKPELVNKFLLHTPTEPVVDHENKTVTITADEEVGSGRLVLHSLKGTDKIEALGGENRNYLINGIQCTSSKGNDGMWGRVELSNTGTTDVDMLNVMYFTDADNDEKLAPTLFEGSNFIAANIGTDNVIYAKGEERLSEEIAFSNEGAGVERYFVIGLHAGTWDIEVDGVTVAHSVASEDGEMITFYAPSGDIRIKPGKDIAPSNGGRIIYYTYGGIVPEDAPQTYIIDEPVVLPTNVVRGHDKFLGWYTSPGLEDDTYVEEIYPTQKGKLEVYAKYLAFALVEDFEDKDFVVNKANKTIGSLSYQGQGKNGSVFEVKTDSDTGNKYLHITAGEKDPQINMTNSPSDYISATDTKLTFELDLAKESGKLGLKSTFRLREQTTSQCVPLFTTTSNGNVVFGGQTLFALKSSFTKLIITVDFENGTMTAFNKYGDVLVERSWNVPGASSAGNTMEYLHVLGYTFNWWIGDYGAGHSMLVDNMKIYCGDFDSSQYQLPEGANIINYMSGVAVMEGDYPETYTVGQPVKLPKATVPNGEFFGWYDNPKFEGEPITEIIATSADEPITVYAKCSSTVYENDFTGSTIKINPEDTTTLTENSISYGCNKLGSTAEAVTDESGNTYIVITTDTEDASINNKLAVSGAAISGGGKLTYEVDLATLPNGKNGRTTFSMRGTEGSSDTINVFLVTPEGNVHLNGKTDKNIGSINKNFTKFIFTVDIYEETITAYDEYGFELAVAPIKVPDKTATVYSTVAEWFGSTEYAFNWHMSAAGGMSFDNIKIYSGGYKVPEGLRPDNSNRLFYHLGNGIFETDVDKIYIAGTPLTLPIPTPLGENELFMGWYDNADFIGDPITVINRENSDEAIHLYAKYALPENMNRIEYDVGLGELDPESPKFYTIGNTVTLLAPTPLGENEIFAGWYDNADFTGEVITSITKDNAGEIVKLYAKYVLPDGMNKFIYEIGSETLPEDAPKFFYKDTAVTLPELTVSENAEFLGWYDNPRFEGEPITEFKTSDTSKSVTLYAKVRTVIFDEDFNESTIDTEAKSQLSEGISYGLDGKVGTTVKAIDANGNKYIRVYTDQRDATINYNNKNVPKMVKSGGGKITYEVSVSTLEDGRSGDTSFRIRSSTGGATNSVNIFATSGGKVYFNNNIELAIGELTTELTKYAFTLDIYTGEFVAYDEYGFVLASTVAVVPAAAASQYATLADWFMTVSYVFNWQMSANGAICYDDIKIYTGEYKSDADIPENSERLELVLGNGTYDGELPFYYTAGVELELPAPTPSGMNEIFAGWYRSPDFSGDPVTKLNEEAAEGKITLYAKYELPANINRIEYEMGDATLPEDAPYFFTEGVKVTLVDPVPNGKYDIFAGWYDNPEHTGDVITEFTMDSADAPKKLYAKYVLPEGVNKIEYIVGGGKLPADAPIYYEVGVAVTLPIPTLVYENLKTAFVGWYTNPEFTGDPVTELTMESAEEPVKLYAHFNIIFIDQDFSDSTAKIEGGDGVAAAGDQNKTFDGIYYQFRDKYAGMQAMSDAAGNIYIRIKTDTTNPDGGTTTCDPQSELQDSKKYNKNAVLANGGKLTYEFDLAVPADVEFIGSTLRLRATKTWDVVPVFKINQAGEVRMNATKHIATLTTQFTRVIITLDVLNETITAYNEYGEVIASDTLVIPKSGAGEDNEGKFASFKDWFVTTGSTYQWYFERGGGIAYDNVKIYAGEYKDYVRMPEGSNKLSFVLNGGAVSDELPMYYVAGEALALPTPVTGIETEVFKGWYRDADLTDGPIFALEEMSAETPIVLYAKYGLPEGTNELEFVVNGGTVVGDVSELYIAGENIILPEVIPDASDEIFHGWYLDAEFTDGPYVGEYTPDNADAPLTFYAKVALEEGIGRLEYVAGDGTLTETLEQYYKVGEAIALPTPVPASSYEKFVGWYLDAEFTGEPVTELIPENADAPITLYAKYELDEGVGKIAYNLGDGALSADAPMYYRAGEKLTLPVPTLDGAVFAGWYTSSAFAKGTRIAEIDKDSADEVVTVYARFLKTTSIYNDDYEDSDLAAETDATYSTSVSKSFDGISYGFNEKSCSVSLKESADGDNYIHLYTNDAASGCDPTISAAPKNFKTHPAADGGRLTFEIDMATHADGRVGESTFRIRESSATVNEVIVIFKIDKTGNVYLGGKPDKVIGTLNSTLIKYIFTLDIYEETLTAYDIYGDVIASIDVSVPSNTKTSAKNVAEWFTYAMNLFQWYFTGKGGVAFDDLYIHTGDYKVPTSLIPEDSNRVLFTVSGGTLPSEEVVLYKAGEELTLPIPTPNEAIAEFKGWYRDAEFTDGPYYTLFMNNATEPVRLYAKFALPENMNIIEFDVGNGVLPSDAPAYYTAGEELVLPTPTRTASFFRGWYRTQDFSDEPITTLIASDASEPIKLYARFSSILLEQDFENSTLNSVEHEKYDTETGASTDDISQDNLNYNLKGKVGSSAIVTEDAEGNKYVEMRTGESADATVRNYNTAKALAPLDFGKVTYQVDVTLLSDGKISNGGMSVRGPKGYSDTINLFGITTTGNLYLNSKSSDAECHLGQLEVGEFISVIVTLDIYEETVTAYNTDGTVIKSVEVSVPASGALPEYDTDSDGVISIAEWHAQTNYLFNWQMAKNGGVAFDNFKIYTGEYIIPEQ